MKTIDLLACCLICQSLKGLYKNKLIVLWKTSFHLTYATLEKSQCAILTFENDRKLEATIKQ